MGKPANEDRQTRESDTKILFKRSINTNFTNSTCCSGASQLVTKSAYLQIKRNLQSNDGSDGTKVKRDLSIETDACILRRYYKIKRHKMSNQGSSGVSKYSTVVDTEIETIEEFPDTSACGDNETMEIRSNRRIDIEALMVDNLKSLLGQWIQKNLLCNKDTQNKLDTVLDSILHKLDSKLVHDTNSDSTYVIHKAEKKQTVKNKKIATSSMSCQYCKSCRGKIQTASSFCRKDSSTLSIPCNYKGIRIISTLSMPRSFHKSRLDHQKKRNSPTFKSKKIKRQNVILSIDDSNKLRKSSSYDLIAISTKSLTQRCANCDNNIKKKRHLVLLPKPLLKISSNCNNSTEQVKGNNNFEVKNEQLEDMSSLLKSLYRTSVDKNVQFDTKNDNFTMTEIIAEENERNASAVLVQNNISPNPFKDDNDGFINQDNQPSVYYEEDDNKQIANLSSRASTKTKVKNVYKKSIQKGNNKHRRIFGHSLTHYTKYHKINSKKFTCLYKKTNNPIYRRDLGKYCQNLFQYFSEHDDNKNIKVDVRINVFPMVEARTKDVCTDVSSQALETYDSNDRPTIFYDDENEASTPIDSQPFIQPISELNIESEQDPTTNSSQSKIIPLLDGAASQVKYIFKVNSGDKTEVKSDMVTGDTSQLGILQEISELRAVIKDLAMTAEKFVNEQIKKTAKTSNAETHYSLNMSDNYTLSSRCEIAINTKNPSKTTQVSTDLEKNRVQSEINKETKREDRFDYYNRLTKKSTSYRIIDSESLLKVTDMTSKANEVTEYLPKFTDEALTCSLPKSRSLFELTSDRNKKLIAFFCDNYVTPNVNNCKIRDSTCIAACPSKSSKTSTKSKKWRFWSKRDASKCPYARTCRSPQAIPLPIPGPDGGYSSSFPSCHSMNSVIIDEEDELVCKLQRRGMGFGEGCVYCLLMWIPILILLVVFYSYVLKDSSDKSADSPKNNSDHGPDNKTLILRNSSRFSVQLSDLGF